MLRNVTTVVAALLIAVASSGQAQSSRPQFAAVSIKPNRSDNQGINNRFGPEVFNYTNVTLRLFVEIMYSLKDYQLFGGPAWMNTEKWDIVARTDGPTDWQRKYEMAKTLLAERFQLQFHWETREMPLYLLVALKDGPRFREPKSDEDGGLRVSSGLLIGHKWDMSTFANVLSSQLNIPIVDKAGLKGIYDFELKWSPAPNEGNFTPNANDGGVPSPADPSGPTIFTALQEQLGLKLESSKGLVEVLVVDSVSKPSEN
jgi:uncharacterized protein (TIGR03435 family)